MIIPTRLFSSQNFGNVVITCPSCGKGGTFIKIGGGNDLRFDKTYVGHRVCPNPNCLEYVLIVFEFNEVIYTFPSLRIDFDTTDVPEKIINTLTEAISCHSNESYIASAIMIRRTLEEICEDKNATGKNLKLRIKNLESQIILPQELLAGMDELRLFGNDAAHIEAKVYDNIGKIELEIAIKFSKEIIKAVYQYSALLRELKSLKKTGEE